MMLKKPGETHRANTMPMGTTTKMKDLVRQVELAVHIPVTVLAEQQPVGKHRKGSKYKPGVDKPKVRPKAKAKAAKSKRTPPQKTKWSALFAADDEERHSLWWDFVKDRSFLSVSYPIDPKDRAEGFKKQLNSQRSRADIQAIKAVGITPHGHDKPLTNEDWCTDAPVGEVCHEANSAFKEVVDNNSAYIRELSRRYCVNCEIGSAILSLRDRTHIIPAAFNSTLVTVERSRALMYDAVRLDAEYLAVEREITALEGQLEPKEQVDWTPPLAADKQLAKQVKAEAVIFDIEPLIGPVEKAVTQSANESVFDKLERQHESDQWPTTQCELYQTMTANPREWRGTDDAKYAVALRRFEKREVVEDQFLTDLKTWAGTEAEIHGRAYLCWLENHYEPRAEYLREQMEWARRVVNPMYEMQLGTYIHELEQTYPAQYKIFIGNLLKTHSLSKHAMNFGEWYVFSTYAVQAIPMRRRLQEKTHAQIQAFYERQEALAEIITEQAMKSVPPVLHAVAESVTQEELPTIDSEVDPVSDDKEKEVVGNVVDMALVKKRRAAEVQQLITGMDLKARMKDLTFEEKYDFIRDVLLELTEAIG